MGWPRLWSVSRVILQTLAYAAVFDYPLTESEINRFLITPRKISPDQIRKNLVLLHRKKKIFKKHGFYYLPNSENMIALRKRRAFFSRPKLKIAYQAADWLRLIPTIKMTAITGALAMNNTQKNDDVDLLIVSRRGAVWLTRLLTVLLMELVSRRRRPNDQKFKDKICLNMFLDENHLALPVKERNLYTAHEVVQIKLLWEKDHLYQKFINQNLWFQKYLANWKPSAAGSS